MLERDNSTGIISRRPIKEAIDKKTLRIFKREISLPNYVQSLDQLVFTILLLRYLLIELTLLLLPPLKATSSYENIYIYIYIFFFLSRTVIVKLNNKDTNNDQLTQFLYL